MAGQAVEKASPAVERQKAVLAMANSIGESIPTSLGALIKTEQIIKAACAQIAENELLCQCSVSSIKRAVLDAASQGLVPGFGGQGWFVPYKNKAGKWDCQWITGYRGKLVMLRREGTIVFAVAEIVYAADEFNMTLGFDQDVVHIPAMENRGSIRGAYFAARDKDGNKYVEWMPVEDLEKAREQAKRGDRETPAWRIWTDEMYRKTVTHRACKRLPLSPDLMRIFEAQLVAEGGGYTVEVEPERPAIEMPRRKSLPAAIDPDDALGVSEADITDPAATEEQQPEPAKEAKEATPASDGSIQGPRFKVSAGDAKFLTPYAEAKGKTVLEVLEAWEDTKAALAEHVKAFYAEQKKAAESNQQPEQGDLIK